MHAAYEQCPMQWTWTVLTLVHCAAKSRAANCDENVTEFTTNSGNRLNFCFEISFFPQSKDHLNQNVNFIFEIFFVLGRKKQKIHFPVAFAK